MTEIETFDLQGNSLGLTENHLNLQYAYGDGAHTSCRLMEEAVSRLLYQVPIQGYCALNMDAMPVLADSVDGVEITVPDNSLAEVDPSFVQGAQVTITGENAETFLRHRDIEQTQSAIARTQRQKVFHLPLLRKKPGRNRERTPVLSRICIISFRTIWLPAWMQASFWIFPRLPGRRNL